MIRMLFFLGTAFFALAEVGAVPTRYDQRQDGKTNVDARLENILLAVFFPSEINSNKVANAALNALEAVAFSRSVPDYSKLDETVRQEEPYSVEVIQIKNHPEEGSVRRAQEGNAETSSATDQQLTAAVGGGQIEKAERIARDLKNFDFPKSREVPVIPGYFMNVRKTSKPKTGDSGRARNVVGNVWNPDDEPGRPGTLLKKQLPRREEEDVAPQPSSNVDKNDVSPSTELKQQELRLVGNGVENCGPGRRRDASGICQFDGLADSL